MSNVAIDLTKTVKEIITTMKTAIDNLNTDVSSNKTAIDNLKGQVLQAVYPVGSVYVSITDSRNPADILGFGTWEALPAGYGLVAQGTATAEDGSTLTFTAGQKSGEFKHQITVGESAKHRHGENASAGANKGYIALIASFPSYDEEHPVYKGQFVDIQPSGKGSNRFSQIMTDDSGEGQPHNNIAPCVATYLWKRTA
ncbi:phage baseplate protein [Megasphaera elsdenii]|uniref:phage baseplate protein n=1 Tax=Megasphaera elsdenii TaxID=907 RepID=UPI00147294B8|nr:hypothetical protein [Megasphaera elsdenii]NME19043.1 hypothetical protein [Megasphaera elsdenii]